MTTAPALSRGLRLPERGEGAMHTRGYYDIGEHVRQVPGRLWCQLWHQSMWKVWHRTERGGPLTYFYCRRCGRQFACTPPRGRLPR